MREKKWELDAREQTPSRPKRSQLFTGLNDAWAEEKGKMIGVLTLID